jgi:hypothetical protein
LNTPLEPAAGVTIDGNGKTLTFDNGTGTGATSAEGLYIKNDGVVIKNIVIDNVTHKDNLIEIYSNATLENVTVSNGAKNGIYVNNDGKGPITVNFKDVTTSGNAWAGVGLVAQKASDSIVANFTGTNSFAETTHVYADITGYQGTVTVNGLTGPTINTKDQKVWSAQ